MIYVGKCVDGCCTYAEQNNGRSGGKHVNTKKKNDVINQSETTKPGSVS